MPWLEIGQKWPFCANFNHSFPWSPPYGKTSEKPSPHLLVTFFSRGALRTGFFVQTEVHVASHGVGVILALWTGPMLEAVGAGHAAPVLRAFHALLAKWQLVATHDSWPIIWTKIYRFISEKYFYTIYTKNYKDVMIILTFILYIISLSTSWSSDVFADSSAAKLRLQLDFALEVGSSMEPRHAVGCDAESLGSRRRCEWKGAIQKLTFVCPWFFLPFCFWNVCVCQLEFSWDHRRYF